jgi:hypothetical protein
MLNYDTLRQLSGDRSRSRLDEARTERLARRAREQRESRGHAPGARGPLLLLAARRHATP